MRSAALVAAMTLIGTTPSPHAAVTAAAGPGGVREVWLLRHCIRSINASALGKYASAPFPSWGVPADYCLPRGLEIYTAVGQHLRVARFPPTIIADDVPRNIASAGALATGLGMQASAVEVNATAFAHCDPPDTKEKGKLIEERFKTVRVAGAGVPSACAAGARRRGGALAAVCSRSRTAGVKAPGHEAAPDCLPGTA